jgi:hypothetical protein
VNNVLTASRMVCAMTCLRKHFWAYEIGLRKAQSSLALRIGSAWARAMDARWRGADYESALLAAVPEGVELDAYQCETVAALLAGYYDLYGETEAKGYLHPETQFKMDLDDGFVAEGKMDVLGQIDTGETVIVEGKTTGDSLAEDSDYWLRLAFNLQVFQYVTAARAHGWDPARAFYDVTRKPSIAPKWVDNLDNQGRKIVRGPDGERTYLKNGKPRLSADPKKGFSIDRHVESPAEFSDRLWQDSGMRPDFYFARREVPIIDYQVETFERQRKSIGRLILSLRENEDEAAGVQFGNSDDYRDPDAWPRNVSTDTCKFCQFKDFCLQNITPRGNDLPLGFTVGLFNPELEEDHASTNENDGEASN